MSRHIIESAIAFFFFFFGIENAFLTCCPPHDRFYVRYGFKEIPGVPRRRHPDFHDVLVCLHGTAAAVPEPARTRICSMEAGIRRTGATCRCPTFPACLPDPYESGDFSASDLFCPLRAMEVLGTTR